MKARQYRDFGKILAVLSQVENFRKLPLEFVHMSLAPSVMYGNYQMVPQQAGFFIWGFLDDEASEQYAQEGRFPPEALGQGKNLWVFYMAALGSSFRVAREAQRYLSSRYPNAIAKSRRHWKDGRVQEWKRAK